MNFLRASFIICLSVSSVMSLINLWHVKKKKRKKKTSGPGMSAIWLLPDNRWALPKNWGREASYWGLWPQGKLLEYFNCSSRKSTAKLGHAFQILLISLITRHRSAVPKFLNIFIVYLFKVIYSIFLRIISTLNLLPAVLFSVAFRYT